MEAVFKWSKRIERVPSAPVLARPLHVFASREPATDPLVRIG
jgi:hypothetical protein